MFNSTCPVWNNSSYYMRTIGTNENIRIWGHNKLFEMSSDFEDEAGPGVVKILQLPAGNYEFHMWDLFYNLGLSQGHQYPKKPFSIPFEVKSDTINYLGQITLKNYSLVFDDRAGRDIDIAISRNPGMRSMPVFKQDLKQVKSPQAEVGRTDETVQMPPPLVK
ncbi:MAG: hypothetical protein AB9866_14725 [Syntrophobacteraceae bacterium]